MSDTLEMCDVALGYGDRAVAEHINLSFMEPAIVSIIGPNGSGKSTLLKALGRLLKPRCGTVYLNGDDIRSWPSAETAKRLSVLPQSAQAPGDMTVRDLAACGRIPYQSAFSQLQETDREAIDNALAATGLQTMADRPLAALSGGERQRAWLAMALAQEPQILLLDEPTTYLDIHYQLDLMELIRQLHQTLRITVIMVMHDLNYAARYSQRLIAVKDGAVMADGSVEEVFVQPVLEALYQVKATVLKVGEGDVTQLVCVPYKTECGMT
ncbi:MULTISPECIES: ABC transporter ATP-binding protein [Megasphaera]|uniref:Putative ferrichrome ABC transporter, ATP-binding protein FhuC n=1 Tax=Megasphaera vaginalis (ex Srinivasan et al. 2021) TaxID=1111454 RepID=U7UMK4_9FIRM|nr:MULTISPECIES: ABC transporter ATP-binding protein [Megasphaera]ERT60129.1 putative ferrichrome ABC transporter, ATP-binding protein FhuC [Megasphaera vaginalis (ex Srinivasan et al. 2021)]